MACVMMLGVAVGGSLAWLTATADEVKNTFTESNITITLKETLPESGVREFEMIPGHTISKDPSVSVDKGSESCWLFIKVVESTTPDLDSYISYAIAGGWTEVQDETTNNDDIKIYARKVMADDTTRSFAILEGNQVTVPNTVNKALMDALAGNVAQPTLAFDAAAVQLYESNGVEFTASNALKNVAWRNIT